MCNAQKWDGVGGVDMDSVGPQQAKHEEAGEEGGPQQGKREAGAGEGLANLGPGLGSSNSSRLEAQLQLLSQLLSPLAGKEGGKGDGGFGPKAGGEGAKLTTAPDAAAAAAAAGLAAGKHASSPQASDAVTLNYNASFEGGVAAATASAPGGDGAHATAESGATAGKRRNAGREQEAQGAVGNRAEPAAVLAHEKERVGDDEGGSNGDAIPRQPPASCLSLHQVLPRATSAATPAMAVEEGTAACVARGRMQQGPRGSAGAGDASGQGAPDVLALVRPVRTGLRQGQRRGRGGPGAAAVDEGWGGPGAGTTTVEAGVGGGETQQQNQQQQQQQRQQGSMPMSPGLAALVRAAAAQLTHPHEQDTGRVLKEELCREDHSPPAAARLQPPLSKPSPPPRRSSSPSHKRPAREFPATTSAPAAEVGAVVPTSGLIPTSLFTSSQPLPAADPAGPKAASISHNTTTSTAAAAAPQTQNPHPSSAAALLAATATTSNAHTTHTINTRLRARTTSATPPPPHAPPPHPPTNANSTHDDLLTNSRATPVPSGHSAPATPPPPKDFHEQRRAAIQYMMSRIAPPHLPRAPARPHVPTPPPHLPGSCAAAVDVNSGSAGGRGGAALLPPNPYALVRQQSGRCGVVAPDDVGAVKGDLAAAAAVAHQQEAPYMNGPQLPIATTSHHKQSGGTTNATPSMVSNPLMPPPLPRPSTRISEAARVKHQHQHPHYQHLSTNTLPATNPANNTNSTAEDKNPNTIHTHGGTSNEGGSSGGSRHAPSSGAAALLARAMGDHAIPPSAPGSIRARGVACHERAKGGPSAPGVEGGTGTAAASFTGAGRSGACTLQRQSVEESHGSAKREACGAHGEAKEEDRGGERREGGETEEAVGLHMPASVAEYTRALLLRSPTCSMQGMHEVPPLSSGLTPTCHGTGLLGTPLSSRMSFVQQALLQQSSPLSSLASPSKVCGPTGLSQSLATPPCSAALPTPLFSPLSPRTHQFALDHPHLSHHHHPQNVQPHHHHHLPTAPFDPTMFFASPLKSSGGSSRDSDTLLPPHHQQQQQQQQQQSASRLSVSVLAGQEHQQ
ncbi:hypothetical protein DUNSADRAFT_17205 [Dunaliella salina]|nr:hypothetical protein DUNSADRAFT_17205 [Dunaliella salina]|eukprot:KAF5828693.1 hypothetical protein DUNSADRAFT_17205 [Dunaliella salina]